jgi:hypothetical protein
MIRRVLGYFFRADLVDNVRYVKNDRFELDDFAQILIKTKILANN